VTDVFIPASRVTEFYAWYREHIRYAPLWIVPYRMPAPYAWIDPRHRDAHGDDTYVDFAIYGMPDDRPGVSYSELLERKAYELGGIKTLISTNHYDRETFWTIYDRGRYERVKQRTDPQNMFRDLFDKRVFARPAPTRDAQRAHALTTAP
jgi:FAD/FMN-containing dehydrogenase